MINDDIIDDFDQQMAIKVYQFCKLKFEPILQKICDQYGLEFDTGMGVWLFQILRDNEHKTLMDVFGINDILDTGCSWASCDEWTAEELKSEVTEGWEVEWTNEMIDFFSWYKALLKEIRSIEDYLNQSLPFNSTHTYGMYCDPYKPK